MQIHAKLPRSTANSPKSKDLNGEKQGKDTLDALLRVVELGELVSEYVLAERAVHGLPNSTESSNRHADLGGGGGRGTDEP